MKLTLGTGNFNNKYFLKNNNFLNLKKKKEIINAAIRNKIKYLDTAPIYGNAEKLIGNSKIKEQKIITKFSRINFKSKKRVSSQIINQFKNSLKRLKKKKIYAILIHDFNDLLKNKKEFMLAFSVLRKKNFVKKIGISLYNYNDLYNLLKFWKPDIIQIPYNIFDRRIENKRFTRIVKEKKIEIHVRSIFFKGLLVDKNIKVNKLKKWDKYFTKWFDWCEKNNVHPYVACFLFIKKNRLIKNTVISFESAMQVNQMRKIKKRHFIYPNFNIKNKKFLNPYNWS